MLKLYEYNLCIRPNYDSVSSEGDNLAIGLVIDLRCQIPPVNVNSE